MHVCVYMYVCIYIYISWQVCVCFYIFVRIYVPMFICVDFYIDTYTHKISKYLQDISPVERSSPYPAVCQGEGLQIPKNLREIWRKKRESSSRWNSHCGTSHFCIQTPRNLFVFSGWFIPNCQLIRNEQTQLTHVADGQLPISSYKKGDATAMLRKW